MLYTYRSLKHPFGVEAVAEARTVDRCLRRTYSVSSLVVPKMEDEFSGTDAGKNSK